MPLLLINITINHFKLIQFLLLGTETAKTTLVGDIHGMEGKC